MRVKQTRKRLKMSQKAVALAANVTVMAISNLEREITRCPSSENLQAIARALRVDPKWLITGQGTKEAASAQSNTSDSFETSPEERALILKYRQLQDSQRTATQTMLDAMDQSKERKKAG